MILHIFAPLLSHYFALTDLAGLYLVSNQFSFDVELKFVFMIEVKLYMYVFITRFTEFRPLACRLKLFFTY